MADASFDINNGANQIAPNAMTQNQYFYGEEFARKILGSKDEPLTLVVLGAGVDATIGLPTSADLIPRIVDFLETDEGKTLDAILRKAIGRVHFHFDKFVSTAIDRLAKDLDKIRRLFPFAIISTTSLPTTQALMSHNASWVCLSFAFSKRCWTSRKEQRLMQRR